jgi:serine/threonine protein kinase
MQVKYLNHGAYGFVLQAHDKDTGNYVALKFVERGGKVPVGWCTHVGIPMLLRETVVSPHRQCCRVTACHACPFMQVDKYAEREILNHQRLLHPHIIQLQEVSRCANQAGVAAPWCWETSCIARLEYPPPPPARPRKDLHAREFQFRIHGRVASRSWLACMLGVHMSKGGNHRGQG